MSDTNENEPDVEAEATGHEHVGPNIRIRFSILTLLILTSMVALYFATRDTDWASLNMNGNSILPLPVDSYPDLPARWGLLNPKELPLDRVLYRQCSQFESLSAPDRVSVRRSISDPMEQTLWEFARRSSVFALRDKDPARVRAGLVALSMFPNRHDFRDVYLTLGLLRRAGDELEHDPAVFEEISKICVPGTSRYNMGVMLKEMTSRDPSSTKSENFVETEFGIGYVESGQGPYDSAGGLLSISMSIAASIEETDPNYRAGSFEIGQRAGPTYWLNSADLDYDFVAKEVESAVQFRAKIDPKIAKGQRFVVDIYHLKSPDAVKQLQAASDDQGMTDKTAILAVSHENIFCIIGSRTYIARGETHETNDSLKRFSNAISQALKR